MDGPCWKLQITEQYRRDHREEEIFGGLETDDEFTGNIWNRSKKLSTDSTEWISSKRISVLPRWQIYNSVSKKLGHPLCFDFLYGLPPSGLPTAESSPYLPHTSYTSVWSHFDHPNKIWWRVQIIKHIMQLSPTSGHFSSLFFSSLNILLKTALLLH